MKYPESTSSLFTNKNRLLSLRHFFLEDFFEFLVIIIDTQFRVIAYRAVQCSKDIFRCQLYTNIAGKCAIGIFTIFFTDDMRTSKTLIYNRTAQIFIPLRRLGFFSLHIILCIIVCYGFDRRIYDCSQLLTSRCRCLLAGNIFIPCNSRGSSSEMRDFGTESGTRTRCLIKFGLRRFRTTSTRNQYDSYGYQCRHKHLSHNLLPL